MEVLKIKKQIYDYIQKGTVDREVIEALMIKGDFIAHECEIWDYKLQYEQSNEDKAKTVKQIVSMYNTYGGYLLYGVEETSEELMFSPRGVHGQEFDLKSLKGNLSKFLGDRIDIVFKEIQFGNFTFGLLHIPKRPIDKPSLSTIKDAQEMRSKKNLLIFSKHTTFFRKHDECIAATTQSHFEFIMGRRELFEQGNGTNEGSRHIISHNLPDKTFICPEFIGRDGIIQELWSWLSDEFVYAKVLAGEGGRGKTSIAYQFSQLVVASGMRLFEQLIWLTAKKKQFRAELNDYVSTPETHFFDAESLLSEVCKRTGSLDEDLEDISLNELKKIASEQLSVIPSLIIVDDVDSAEPNEQKRILEVSRQITGTNKSKVLLTTRANVSYSSDTSIEVPGLNGGEYCDYVSSLCKRYEQKSLHKRNLAKLETVSEGSPLFTESIFRLLRTGNTLDSALNKWEGHSGSAVRNAALEREISQLSTLSKEVLFVLCVSGDASQAEIASVAEIDMIELDDIIQELGSLFLIQDNRIIEEQPRFKIAMSLKELLLSNSNKYLPSGEAFMRKCHDRYESLLMNQKSEQRNEVGKAIKQSLALMYTKEYEKALKTIDTLLVKATYHKNKDLLLMRARINFNDPSVDNTAVKRQLQEAYENGQKKEELFDLLYELEKGSDTGVIEVAKQAIEVLGEKFSWLNRLELAKTRKAAKTNNFERKVKLLAEVHELINKQISIATSSSRKELIERSVEVTGEIYQLCTQNKAFDMGVVCSINAIKGGDVKRSNFYNAIYCMERIADIVKNNNISIKTRKEHFINLEKWLNEFDYLIQHRLAENFDLLKSFSEKVMSIKESAIYSCQFELGMGRAPLKK